MLVKEYLGEGIKRRELQGSGRISAITGGQFARKEAKGKTNEGKDVTEAGGAAGESWNKKARPAPTPKDAGGPAHKTIVAVKTGVTAQPNRAWISRFASMQQHDSAHSVLASDSPHSVSQGSLMGKDRDNVRRDKRVGKPKELKDFVAEPQLKKSRVADEKASDPRLSMITNLDAISSEKQQEQMRILIQHAAQRADTQQVVISNQLIRLPQLLTAIRDKGMENGNVVWVQVAMLLGINVKCCHDYSTKFLQLLEGSALDDGRFSRVKKSSKNRPSAGKSKGISKRPAMMGIAKPQSQYPRAPPKRKIQSRLLEVDKEQCRIWQDTHTSYVTLNLLTGVTLKDRERYTHVLPKRHTMVPRDDGLVAAHSGVRKAAQLAQSLWAQSILRHVATCDSLQERLKSRKVARSTNVKGWDLSRLGRLVVAAAVGQGLVYTACSKLCSTNLEPHQIAALEYSDDRKKKICRSLEQVHRSTGTPECAASAGLWAT